MKRALIAAIAYCTTGMGFYHVFFGDANIYGFIILVIGLAGILYDMFFKMLNPV